MRDQRTDDRQGAGTPPRASVLVTSYRTPASLLRASLESVLAQTEPAIEAVLVLDGIPSPHERRVVDELQADPRLRVVEPGRVGRGRALNLGVRAATGAIIAIQDADDESHPERLRRQLAVFEQRPDVDLLASDVRLTRKLDERASWPLPSQAADLTIVGDELLRRNPFVHSSVAVRRQALEHVSGYSAGRHRHFDYDLYLRIRRAGGTIAVLHDPLVLKRLHDRQGFEQDSILLQRVWATYRLQMEHALDEEGLERVATCARVTVRQGGHLARGKLRSRRARRALVRGR